VETGVSCDVGRLVRSDKASLLRLPLVCMMMLESDVWSEECKSGGVVHTSDDRVLYEAVVMKC
jgi:hypothetical protein